MGAILNGIALQSLTRPYGGTFLVFSDYMRPAVRLAALMQLPAMTSALYAWHNSPAPRKADGIPDPTPDLSVDADAAADRLGPARL